MNTPDTNTHPFGYWITAVDRLMRAEFATVFEDEGITRRDWRMLNRIDGTVADARPVHGARLHRLVELGWVERTREGWILTDAGTLAKQRLSTAVDELRARVAGVVTPDEYAAMTASLEKIAREFGWAEGRRLPRRHSRGEHHERDGFRGGHRGFHGQREHAHGERGHVHGQREHFRGDRAEHCEHGEGFGPHARHGHGIRHGLHRQMAPQAHIHIHTHG